MPEVTCIVCPTGCRISVDVNDGEPKVAGHLCPRGARYAVDEVTAPKRMLTSVVRVHGRKRLLPVKSATPIPKNRLFPAMREVTELTLEPPIRIGQVLKENLAETGIALVATKDMK